MTLWHYQRRILSLMFSFFLISGCAKESPPSEPILAASPKTEEEIKKPEEVAVIPPASVVADIEEPKAASQAPKLDFPIDHAISHGNFGGSGGGGSSPPIGVGGSGGGGGGGGGGGESHENNHDMDMLLHWNEMAMTATGQDHNLSSGPSVLGGVREQMGPGRSSRAMAIVHIAIFEAINAIKGGYESYVGLPPQTLATSVEAAIAVAAYDTLVELFPSQSGIFQYQKALDLQDIPESAAKDRGIQLGHDAALAILTLRANDGSDIPEPVIGVDFIPSNDPGKWRKDPISNIPMALGAHWGDVDPFVLPSIVDFRTPPPPDLTSPEYTAAFNEVKSLGGDGINTLTDRTEEQTEIGIYWAYDGVPSLCAPPRLFNQIAVKIAEQEGTDMVGLARLLALINVAMADTTTAGWESKYYYQFWRPVTGIREADPGTGPSMIGDGNPSTVGDVNFYPLGAPASNMVNGVDFTPPFPAYPSGHATMGGATFEVLRKFYGTDDITFTFVSDELDGKTKDKNGNVRPLRPRTFTSLSQAEEENGQSRIYLGIHWAFDKTAGIAQGNDVADYVWEHIFTPIN
jgi:hypothetical protein